MTNYSTTSLSTKKFGESLTSGSDPDVRKSLENRSICLTSQSLKHLSLILLLLVMGVGSVWGETANVADGGNITATTTLSNDNKTCTWANVSATAKVEKGTSSYGHGLGIVASSSSGVEAGVISTLKNVATLYVKVPSATSTGNIGVCKATADGSDRTLTLKGGNTMTQTKGDSQNVAFSSNDIVNVNGGYYIQLTNSGTDFKYSEIVVTLTKDGETYTTASIYTVIFNADSNGSCGTTSLTETSTGAGVTLPTATPNSGYAFTGWFNSSKIRMGGAYDTYTPTANETLTAHYAQTSGTTLGAASGAVTFDTEKTSTTTMNSGDTWKFKFNSYGRPNYNVATSSFSDPHNNWVFVAGNYYCRADNWTWISGSNGVHGTLTGDWNSYMTALENGAPVEIIAKYTGSAVEMTGKTTYGGSTYTVSYNSSGNAGTLTSGSSLSAYLTIENAYITNYTATLMPTITFNANGGTGTMTAQVVDNNVATALSTNTFTRAGYNFTGWATSADGERVYNDGGNITLTANTTLYAKWEQANSITITTQPQSENFEQWVTPTALNVVATATNGAELSYQWYTCNSDGSSELAISRATNASYTPGTTSANTFYLKCKISAEGCADVYTNVVTMTPTNTQNNTVSNLTTIDQTYTFTPSTKLKAKALTSDEKILAVDGGNDFNNLGMSFKTGRQLAFKVAAGAIITIQLYNNGNAERTAVLSTSAGHTENVTTSQAVASGGTATLTYTSTEGGTYYLCGASDLYVKSINVTWAATSVTVSPTSVYVSLAGTETLTATVSPDNVTNKNVTWSSADNTIATVDASGKVTGKATYGGVTKVTATTEDGGHTAETTVNVYRFTPGGITTTYQTGASGSVTYIPVAFYDGFDGEGNFQSVSLSLSDFSIESNNTSVISIPQLYFDSSKSRLSFTPTIGSTGTATVTITYNGSNTHYAGKTCTINYTVTNNSYTVSYEMKGHGTQEAQATDVTELPNPLPTPTGDGYTFVGWYTEDALTNAAEAGAAISANTTLYAKWTIDKGYISPLYANGDGKSVTLDHIQEPQRGMGVLLPGAYETTEDITIPANTDDETGKNNWSYADDVKNKDPYSGNKTFREAYFAKSVPEGNVLTQQVTGLTNGKYEVVLDVAASYTSARGFECPTGNSLTQAFAGTATKYIPVIERTVVGVNSDEYDRIALVTEVTDGTLTYGLKNTAASGNWYLCRVHSIKKVTNEHFLGWYNDAENGTRVGGEGDNHVPNYNGTALYAHWKKSYTFRPVASNGNLVSVTVNDVAVENPQNNHDITVYEGDKIVMTATPATGYKFKNWVLSSGGTAGVESVDGSNYIYTISAIAANTTLSAKFEAKGTGTDPNPANGSLDGTTVTINAFPASYAGKTQSIDLGLPTGASAVVKTDGTGLSASITNGVLSIKAPAAPTGTDPTTASITITVTAEDGTTVKDYTVTVSTAKGAEYNYTVKAVDGSGNVLQVLKSGVYAEGTTAITIAYPQYIKKDNTLYNIAQASDNPGWYRVTFTPTQDNFVQTLTYNHGTVGDIVYFTEAEDISGFTATGNNYSRASNGAAARSASTDCYTTTLNRGTYKIVARGVNGDSSERLATFKANGTSVFDFHITASSSNVIGEQLITVTEDNTDITVSCSGSNNGGLDWFYIQDLKTLPVTVDGQKLGLTTDIIDNTSYTTVNAAGKTSTFTRDEFTGTFYIVKNSSQNITVTEQGATSFEVFAFHNNSSSTRTLNVYVGDDNVGSISVVPGTTCSSGIIPIASASSAKTITLKGTGSDVYPAYIVFYNTPKAPSITPNSMELGLNQTKTVTPAVPENCNISGMVEQTSTEIATATYSDGVLTVKGNKVGKTTVTFNVTGDGSAYASSGTATFTITVTPLDLTLAYSRKEYVFKEEEAEGAQPALPTITLTATDENGTTVDISTAGISMAYTSDDASVATVSNDGVITLQSGAIGSATITAMAAKSTNYSAATATFYISITRGKSWKMGTDNYSDGNSSDKIGDKDNAPAIRNQFTIKDDSENVLVTATFGGWNRNNGKYNVDDPEEYNSGNKTDSWSETLTKTPDIDGYTVYRHGANDAMNEDMYASGTREGSPATIYGSQRNGWFISPIQNGVMTGTKHPFTLPVRGTYMTFEPEVNGTLTVYINQNGAWNSKKKDVKDNEGKDICEGVEFPGKAPFQFRPHSFYIVDQDGMPLQRYTKLNVVTKTKVNTGLANGVALEKTIDNNKDYGSDKEKKKLYDNAVAQLGLLNKFCATYGVKKGEKFKCIIDPTADGYNDATNIGNWKDFKEYMSAAEQQRVCDAWSKGVDGAQQIIEMDNGSFLAIDEGMTKYTLYVAAHQTYYIFSNFSKLGFAGCNFVPDTEEGHQPTATLALSETEAYSAPVLDATDANGKTNHVGNITIPQYKTITLNRSFTADNWNTICLPFTMTEKEVREQFGEGTELIIMDKVNVDNTTLTLNFVYHEIQNICNQ